MKRHDEDEGDALSRKKARVLKNKSAQKRVEKPLAPADACVGVVVLGNSTLLRHVTSFLRGIPHRLLELEVNNGVTMDARRKANKAVRDLDGLDMYLDRETPQVKSLIENHRLAYRSLTDMAIETNEMRSLEMVYELHKEDERRKHPRFRFYHAMQAAARCGRLEMLKWLSRLDEATEWLEDSWLLDAAIQSKSLETVQWVMKHYRGEEEHMILTKTLDQTTKDGALDVLKLILTSFPSARLTTKAMDGAAEGNHFDVVLYFHETRNEGCTTQPMNNAAGNGHLDMVKWLHENRSEGCTSAAIDNAATNGYLHVIKFLHEHRAEGCSSRAMEGSAENGHLEVIRYLHEKCGRYFTADMLLKGMKNLEIVRYVLDNGGPDGWYRRVTDLACGTSLEHAQLFHHRRACGFTIYSMDETAAAGHLETVRFLHEHRTEDCTTAAMDGAAPGGFLDVVRFLHAHRGEGCTSAAMDKPLRVVTSMSFCFSTRIATKGVPQMQLMKLRRMVIWKSSSLFTRITPRGLRRRHLKVQQQMDTLTSSVS